MVAFNRFDVFLVTLDPTKGSEINKTRPCLIISPNEMNHNIKTLIIAPMTTTSKDYPTRIPISFNNKDGFVALDQIRTIAKERCIKKLGTIDETEAKQTLKTLQKMFADI